MAKPDTAFKIVAFAIRSAMADRGVEPPQKFAVDTLRRIESKLTADAAHKLNLVLRF